MLPITSRRTRRHIASAISRCIVESLEERRLLATTLVSANALGSAGVNGAIGGVGSNQEVISTDGRYVAFVSSATDAVSGITTTGNQIYLRDLTTNTTVLVSHNSAGNGVDRGALEPRFSHDGRFVLFESESTDLPGDSDFTAQDIYVYTIATGEIDHVSPGSSIQVGQSQITADGRYVVYSTGKNIFRHDRDTNSTVHVNVTTGGGLTDFASGDARISDDGRYIAFYSFAPDLPGGGTDLNKPKIFLRDMVTSTNTIVTPDADGPGIGRIGMSADGRYIAFSVNSTTGSYVGGNNYVWDRTTGVVSLASKRSSGAPLSNLPFSILNFSRDGSTIAFINNQTDIVASDPNGTETDIYIYTVATGVTTRLSTPSNVTELSLSDNGQVVAFRSFATPAQGSAATDNNDAGDIFVHNRATGANRLLSTKFDNSGSSATGSLDQRISGDGTKVIFLHSGTDLVSGFVDGNGSFAEDLYAADASGGIPAEGGAGSGDTTGPTATLGALGDVIAGEPASNIEIVFTDPAGVDYTTLNTSLPLAITGPDDSPIVANFLALTDISSSGVRAMYQVPALGGSFDATDNGTYSVSVPGGLIQDLEGNASPAASIGSFVLTVAGTGGLSGLTAEVLVGPTFLPRLLAARSAPVTIRVTNPTDFSFSGDVDADVVASTDGSIDDADERLGAITGKGIRVRASRTSSFTVTVTLDADVPAGDYFIGARLLLKDKDTGAVLRTLDVITAAPITLPATRSGVIDSDGTLIRVSMRGATGGLVFDPGSGLFDLIVTTSDTTRSITFSVTRGDRVAVLRDIRITGSARSILGSRVDLRGIVDVSGSLRSLTLRDIADQHTINIAGADTPVKMKFGNVSELSITSAARITSLDVKNWTDQDATPDVITAPSIGTLRSRGDFNADVNLSGVGVEQGKRTLSTVRVSGNIGAGVWNVTGNVGSIRAASILAGWAATVFGEVRSVRTTGDATGNLSCFALDSKRIDGNDLLTVDIVT